MSAYSGNSGNSGNKAWSRYTEPDDGGWAEEGASDLWGPLVQCVDLPRSPAMFTDNVDACSLLEGGVFLEAKFSRASVTLGSSEVQGIVAPEIVVMAVAVRRRWTVGGNWWPWGAYHEAGEGARAHLQVACLLTADNGHAIGWAPIVITAKGYQAGSLYRGLADARKEVLRAGGGSLYPFRVLVAPAPQVEPVKEGSRHTFRPLTVGLMRTESGSLNLQGMFGGTQAADEASKWLASTDGAAWVSRWSGRR